MLGAFMAVFDIQITSSSLRDITGGIAATQDEGSWIPTSYLIGEIINIAFTAWLPFPKASSRLAWSFSA
jgi:DHA2 family multidrug resistance protein